MQVRTAKQVEVIHVVPVVFRRNILRAVICKLQAFSFPELFDRILGAARPPQFMTMHVVGVRNGWSELDEQSAIRDSSPQFADFFQGMHTEMQCTGILTD